METPIESESQTELITQTEEPKYALQRNESRAVAVSSPSDLFLIALEKGATMDQIEKFMELQERHEANQAKKAYVAAMADFKRNPPKIDKDKHVEFSGVSYNHATLGNICNIIIPALAEYGISHNWSQTQPGDGMIRVTCTLTHSLGHSESNTMEAPPDNGGKMNPIQRMGSTVTYLQRYTFLAACGLSTSEIDDDGRDSGDTGKEPEIVKKTLSGKSFEKAIAAVQAGTYTAADIDKYYTLTTDQQIMLDDEIKKSKVSK